MSLRRGRRGADDMNDGLILSCPKAGALERLAFSGRTTPDSRRLWKGVTIAVVVSVAVTIAGATSSRVPVVYRSTATHVALDTSAGIIALLAAYVLFGRFRYSGRTPDLLTALSLGVLGITNVSFAVASAGAADEGSPIRVWTPLIWRLVGAILLAVASVSAERTLLGRRRVVAAGGVAVVIVLFACTLATELLVGRLPTLAVPPVHRLVPFRPLPIATIQLLSAVIVLAAAAAFGRRAVRSGDEFYRWLSASCVVFAFARLNYAIFPSLYSSWVYTGDVLRLGFYLLVLTGAAREISGFQRRAAEQEAVIEERRRLARDLHDGLAQDLAYIALDARLLLAQYPSSRLEQLAETAERALDHSRYAITALAPMNGTLGEAIIAAAEDVASRGSVRLYLDVPRDATASQPVREALIQITREAVRNATKHGSPKHVWLVLSLADRRLRLAIVDDGQGFRTREPAIGSGFGLTSMRERAERIGASFRIDSGANGTTVEVVVG